MLRDLSLLPDPRALLTLLVVLLAKLSIHVYATVRRADGDAYRQANRDL